MKDHSGKSRERQQLENKWLPVLLDSPSTEQIQQAYDEQYALFMEEGICRHVVKKELPKYKQSLIEGIDGGKRVLEIGFGNGVMSFQIARRGNRTVGIDVSKIFLELAKSKLHGETGLDL